MNMQSQSLLDEWKKLARVENRRMRENLDGAPWGSLQKWSPPKTDDIDHLADRAVQMLREKPMSGGEILKALHVGHGTWRMVREVLTSRGAIRNAGAGGRYTRWEAVE